MVSLFRLENIFTSLGKKNILKEIHLTIYQHEIFGLIGPSGAGKSTLLKTIIGYHAPTTGKILFQEKEITGKLNYLRSIMGFASQDYSIYEELTVLENLEYFGRIYRLDKNAIKNNSIRALSLVELSDNKNDLALNLSGGMKRRLDIACAIMHNPAILIMDEPTTGLDPILRKHMWSVIERIRQGGTTIILSSHLLDDVEHLCNRVGIIFKGELLVVGSPTQIKDLYTKNHEIHLQSYPGNYKAIIEKLHKDALPIQSFVDHVHKLVIYTPQSEVVLHHILHILEEAGERLIDVDVNKPSLNEVFEAYARLKK